MERSESVNWNIGGTFLGGGAFVVAIIFHACVRNIPNTTEPESRKAKDRIERKTEAHHLDMQTALGVEGLEGVPADNGGIL